MCFNQLLESLCSVDLIITLLLKMIYSYGLREGTSTLNFAYACDVYETFSTPMSDCVTSLAFGKWMHPFSILTASNEILSLNSTVDGLYIIYMET